MFGKLFGKNNKVSQEARPSEIAEKMIVKYGYPHKVFPAGTDYENIMNEYWDRVKVGKDNGFTPVLVTVDSIIEETWSIFEDDGYSVDQALQNVSTEEGRMSLEERYKLNQECDRDFDEWEKEIIGEYNDEPEVDWRFVAFKDCRTKSTAEVILYDVPTPNPWEVVAYLPFGGWNECPEPDDMASICKYWYDKYGAVPVTISHDILEMCVPEPVSEENALQLAKEHFAFTPDRVYQGTRTNTISEVAACLAMSNIWYFWWD